MQRSEVQQLEGWTAEYLLLPVEKLLLLKVITTGHATIITQERSHKGAVGQGRKMMAKKIPIKFHSSTLTMSFFYH